MIGANNHHALLQFQKSLASIWREKSTCDRFAVLEGDHAQDCDEGEIDPHN
jgi:hypothetical protein